MIEFGIFSLIFLNLLTRSCHSAGGANHNYLKFDSIVKDDNNNLKYLITLSQPVTLDGSVTNQILVQNYWNFNSKNVNIILFHCRVKPLRNESKIKMAEICYRPTLKSNELCHNVMNNNIIDIGPALSIQIDWDPLTGFSADFSIKSNLRSNDGLYYCKLGNKHHSIVSNYIELENVANQFTKQLSHIVPVEQVQPIKIIDFSPISLHCGRNTFTQSGNHLKFTKSPFYWIFWEKLKNQQKPLSPVNDIMEYVQHQNGTLEILRFLKTQTSMYLMCKNELSETYYSIYTLDVNIQVQSSQYHWRIRDASPSKLRVVLREGPVGLKMETLTAVYYSNPVPAMTKAVWKRNNVLLSDIYPEALFNNYNFLFPNFIHDKFSGQYNLHVDQVQPVDHTMFIFDVDVITVPKFKSKPSEILYKIVGQSAEFLVEVSGNPSSMEIYIDNLPIQINRDPTSNSTEFIASIKSIDQQNIEVKLAVANVTNNMTAITPYIEHDKKINRSPFSRIYTVTFIANSRNLTSSRMSHLLHVLSYPELSTGGGTQLDYCPISDRFNLSYVTNTDQYIEAGLEVDHQWTVTDADNQPISDTAARYVTIRNATVFLNRSIIELAPGLQLRYRMQIFHQSSINPARTLIFDSNNHPDLVALFHTRIHCISLSEFPVVIVAIIIAIVVAILIILILALCLTKKKGETYNIDKNERAMGHDPEAEFRENETFLNYERQNDDMQSTKASRMSLDNDSVGEVTDGGELDDGGIDTASYSEEGSFIHEYSSDSKSRINATAATAAITTDKTKDSLV